MIIGEESHFVLLSAPPGLGKTSLLSLFHYRHPEFRYEHTCFYFTFTPTDFLAKNGIDVLEKKCHIPPPSDRKLRVFMLDACQERYGDVTFWTELLGDSALWLPAHVRFVISTTCMLEMDAPACPIPLSTIPHKLERNDFLLNDEDANLLFTMVNGLPLEMRFLTLMKVVIRECNGLIGALPIDAILQYVVFHMAASDEHSLVDYYFSAEFLDVMGHHFRGKHVITTGGELQSFLIKCFFRDSSPEPLPWTLFSDDEKQCFTRLMKSGIVTKGPDNLVVFSPPLARRFYSTQLFPKRGAENSKSLHELIKKVIGSLSASSIKASITSEADFKVDAFQHHFMTVLALHTHPTSCICSELAKAFPDFPSEVDKQTNEGVDFYLAGSLGWGIELHVNGDDLDEHTARFAPGGKYAALAAKEYVVVDLRCNKEGKPRPGFCKQEKTTVFFELGDSRQRSVVMPPMRTHQLNWRTKLFSAPGFNVCLPGIV